MTRLVVIEDSATQAAAVRASLLAAGFEVEVAHGGKPGLEACRASPPDLVLTDIVMPDLDGYAVTRALREDPRTAHVPVIVMTTLEDPSHVLEAVRSGADNYITKPLSMDVVLPRIQRALAGPGEADSQLLRPALAAVLVSCLEDAAARHEALARKQEELERTNAQREQSMRIVAHELRGPLQALSMRAAAASAMGSAGPLLKSLPVAIEGTVGSMVRIIEDLTDLTDLDLGRLVLDRRPMSVDDLARRLVDEVRGLHPQRTFELEAAGCALADADPTRLEQVLRNFLTNAVKYTTGTIRVDVRDEQGMVKLTVADEGPGLSPEACDRVFERYARISGGAEKPRGAGLGLYICRSILELHDGAVGVDSEPGQGSSFWFRVHHADQRSPRRASAGCGVAVTD